MAWNGCIVDMGAYEATYTYDFVVDTSSDTDLQGCSPSPGDCSLRGAINLANTLSGTDTLTFDSTVFSTAQTITLSSALPRVTSAMIIDGPGASLLTVDGQDAYRVFYAGTGSDLTLSNLTVANGSADNGGAVFVSGATLAVNDSVLSDNAASNIGGAIAVVGNSTVTVSNSTLSDNSADIRAGGVYVQGSIAVVSNSTLSGNSAGEGGGFYVNANSTSTVTNSTIAGNSSSSGGAGLHNAGTLTLNNSIVAANTGGTGECAGGGTATVKHSLIQDGSCGITSGVAGNLTGDPNLGTLTGSPAYYPLNAGSIAVNAGNNNLAVDENDNPLTTDQAGNARIRGGIVDMGAYELQYTPDFVVDRTDDLNVNVCSTAANDCSLRGAITLANALSGTDTLTFDSTVFSTAQTITLTSALPDVTSAIIIDGPGADLLTVDGASAYRVFYADTGADLTLNGLTIAHGSAVNGAAVYVTGATLTVNDSVLSNNAATNRAGAIYVIENSTVTVSNGTISDNSADSGGGGGVFVRGSTAVVTNSTLSGNSAGNLGGGFLANAASTSTITNSTIAGNSSSSGGAGINNGGALTLNNSIVASNTGGSGECAGGGTATVQHSLIQDGSCGITDGVDGNLSGDPQLGALADNGGPTQTMALQDTSPAINAGDNTLALDAEGGTLNYDQRGSGYDRNFGGTVDMGAYELVYTPDFVVDRTDDLNITACTAATNDCSLRGAINLANALGTNDTITFSVSGTIPLTSGLSIADAASAGKLTIEGSDVITLDGGSYTSGFFSIFNINSGADATLNGLTIYNGYSGNNGGGIYNNGGTLTVNHSTLDKNGAPQYGGGIYNNGGTLTISGSTLSSNTADNAYGGGLYVNGGTVTIINSTFTDNLADSGGSALHVSGGASVTVINSTVAGNNGSTAVYTQAGTLNLHNTIVANNSGSDCTRSGGTINAQNSLIGDSLTCVSGTNTNNLTGDPNLGTLTGDPAYYPLNPDSIAINAGDNDLAVDENGNPLTTDQAGNDRIQGPAVDMGAYELPPVPYVSITPASVNVTEGGNTDLTIARTVDTSTAIEVSLTLSLSSQVTSGDYNLSGALTGTPSGALTVSIPANTASVTVNVAALADAVGAEADDVLTFTIDDGLTYNLGTPSEAAVTIPANDLLVTNLNDSGEGSLRQAILNANSFDSDDTITFSVSGTIATGSGLTIADNGSLIIDGGAITVDRSGLGSFFRVNSGADATFEGLTISGGVASFGAGIYNNGGTLTVSHSTLSNNEAANSGGGIYSTGGGTLIVDSSTFSGNAIDNDEGAGIAVASGTATIVNSTFSGNSGDLGIGGGLSVRNATVTVTNSTFAYNKGFDVVRISGTLNLYNSVLAYNSGQQCSGTVNVQHSLIQDGSCGINDGVGGNLTGDPNLGTLTGDPAYYPLSFNSIAVDAGDNALVPGGVTTDQAGNPRILGPAVDMGAYESVAGSITIVKDASLTDGTDFAFTTDALSGGNYLLQWGSGGTGDGLFRAPYGVAVDATGNVYVVDANNNRIQKFDRNGTYLTQWGGSGSGDGQFSRPIGVAVDAAGNVYVVDANNNRIQKFDSNGTYLTQWGSYGSGDGQFDSPSGVAVDAAGDVYVSDVINNRIQKFDSNGTYLTQWGSSGSGDGQFDSPGDVAVDATGNVYVVDHNNYRIQKFDRDGTTYLTQWGGYGGGTGQFYGPNGVAVDAAGNVHVTDNLGRIQKFDSNGTYLTEWGSFGSGNGQFRFPQGVAVSATGNVYVVDRDNNRVQVFSSDTFSLDDAVPDDGDLITDSKTIALFPGSYTFTETITAAGWELTSLTCDSGSWSVNGNSVSIDLAAGEDVTCTFANTPLDTTPPVISATVSGTEGDNGWYTSDVTVSWTVSDDESAVTATNGCDATTIDSDTAGTTLTCEATSAGGTNSASVTIKRDATPPTASASLSPAANANGWNNTDVTVSFSGSDATSGIASCDADVILSSEGSDQSASGTCTDNAGNLSAAATASGINIDKTDPLVSVTGVEDGATYILGSVPTAACDTSDALSGVASPASLTVSGGNSDGTGTFTATCNGAFDNAGNSGSASVTYTVDGPGTLIVQKVVINDNGGTQSATDFTFQVNGGSAVNFLEDTDALHGENTLTLDAGSYSVSEPAVTGYTTTYENCSDLKIANGNTQTCTITNNDQPGTLIV